MFTWICPQCGREVPPAYDECPDCAAKAKSGAEPAQPAAAPPPPAPPPPQPVAAPPQPPPQPAYVPPAYAPPAYTPPPAYAAPRARPALPTWLMSIIFALAFIGLAAGVWWMIDHFRGGPRATGPAAALETPPAATKGSAKSHPLQKYIEVTGIRLLEDKKKRPEVHFIVVNHSGAEVTDLGATVNIWGRTQKSEEESVGNFTFKLASLGPYEAKEAVAPLNTKLRVYELPDWQNVTDEIQITSP